MILADNCLSHIRRNPFLKNQSQNQIASDQENSSEYKKENIDDIARGLRTLRFKQKQPPVVLCKKRYS